MRAASWFVLVLGASACSSDPDSSESTAPESTAPESTAPEPTAPEPTAPEVPDDVASLPAGITVVADDMVFKTEEFIVAPGEERFLCYAADAPAAFNAGTISVAPRPVVHHLLFSKTTTDVDVLGFAECETLFKTAWRPIIGSTTAGSSMELPSDSAHVIDVGQRLVAQLHLLNTGDADVTEVFTVRMGRSSIENPRPVGLFVMGAIDVNLPPLQETVLEGNCTMQADADLFAMMPHMHYLGTSLTLEVGPSEAELQTVFERNPYNFEDQYMEPFEMVIPAGYHARTRCTFNNTRNETVTFGESSLNEMCFAVGFASGVDGVSGCFGGP